MTSEEIRACLRSSPLVRTLGESSIEELATRVRVASWPRNEVILRKGDPGDAMMIVHRGRVKITSISDGGRERILNIIEPGECFGEMALLDGQPRCADAVAMEPTTALILSHRVYQDFLTRNPSFAMRLIAELCRRLRKATNVIEDTLLLEPEARLARRIRALIHESGEPRAGGGWVLRGLSQQDLADAIGVTRESVNKLLSRWRAEGAVSLERRTVIVHDLDRIERMAGEPS